jgi:hypothetical protein
MPAPGPEVGLLRKLPMFAPLPLAVTELLAAEEQLDVRDRLVARPVPHEPSRPRRARDRACPHRVAHVSRRYQA